MTKIKLTKVKHDVKSHSSSMDEGQTFEGNIVENSVWPSEPTVGKPFVINIYRTSQVEEIISPNTFRTCNSTYRWEKISP